jgi:O-antigen/teichoic acid export membrane protein
VIALVTTFFSKIIVTTLFGDAFSAAGIVLSAHIWAAPFVFLGVASERWILTENRPILSFQRAVLGTVLNVSLNFVLIPTYGPLGAAIATVFSYAVAGFFADLIQKETMKIFYMKLSSLNVFSAIKRLNSLRKGVTV